MFLGLRSLIYPAPDIDASKEWYTNMLGFEPYFDEPDYVGFDLGGYELGLFRLGDPTLGPLTYWGVGDAEQALAHLVAAGAAIKEPLHDIGPLRMASVTDSAGYVFGIIQNPDFAIKAVPSAGPGR